MARTKAAAANWARLSDLRPWDRNPRRNEAAIEKVMDSIRRFGFGAPLVARKADGRIISGHTRYEAAKRLGIERVPVRYLDLSEAEADALAIADNRLGEIAEWDTDGLTALLADLRSEEVSLDGLGFDEGEIDRLLDAFAGEEREARPERVSETAAPVDEEDPIDPGPGVVAVSTEGTLYELGPHRLVCGDATRPETLAQLLAGAEGGKVDAMFTDPPYAIYGSSTGISSSITDDKIVRPFFRAVLEQGDRALPLFGPAFVCCDWRSWPSWWEVSKGGHLEPKNLLVWDKNGSGLGSNFANTYELIGYFIKVPEQKAMTAKRLTGIRSVNASNIIRAKKPSGAERVHNAQKPVEVITYVLGKVGDVRTVLDLFGGSGSTLIAASEIGAVAYLTEIDPKWCDVIRRRWTRYAKDHNLDPGAGALE